MLIQRRSGTPVISTQWVTRPMLRLPGTIAHGKYWLIDRAVGPRFGHALMFTRLTGTTPRRRDNSRRASTIWRERSHESVLWPALCSTPRYLLHGPTVSRYWCAMILEIW